MMAQQRRQDCRLIFVSSFLGFTTFAGYSSYSPAKYALRGECHARNCLTTGLADTLRSELLLYGIKVHLYVPAGILTPGFETENLTKPKITRKIEEGDTPISAEACTDILLNGTLNFTYDVDVQASVRGDTRSQMIWSRISFVSSRREQSLGTMS